VGSFGKTLVQSYRISKWTLLVSVSIPLILIVLYGDGARDVIGKDLRFSFFPILLVIAGITVALRGGFTIVNFERNKEETFWLLLMFLAHFGIAILFWFYSWKLFSL